MKKMTYKKLMQMVEDGDAEVRCWAFSQPEGEVAEVAFWKKDGRREVKMVVVTGMKQEN